MSALHDPAFWALAAGFALILYGLSPLGRVAFAYEPDVSPANLERGCASIMIGIVIVIGVTVIKVLG